nr:hypothetical protein CFP56_68148 [Quercus suber]
MLPSSKNRNHSHIPNARGSGTGRYNVQDKSSPSRWACLARLDSYKPTSAVIFPRVSGRIGVASPWPTVSSRSFASRGVNNYLKHPPPSPS